MGDDPLPRLATAAERIAVALEYLARHAAPAGPAPRVKLARAPSDVSRYPAVTRSGDRLTALVQNTGDGDTFLTQPTARLGSVELTGGVLDRDSRVQPGGPLLAAPDGPGVTVLFDLDVQGHVLDDLPLVVRLPHHPGRFPGGTVLEVSMEPTGVSDGRAGWREVGARELPADDGTA